MPAVKILVVEDESTLQKSIVKGLKKYGYAADAASDGEEALEAAAVNFYDLIVLDLNLPKLDGIGVLRELRRSGDKTAVLILSARAEVGDRIEGLDSGADDFLAKPFHFAELEARIRALLRRNFSRIDTAVPFWGFTLDTVKKSVAFGSAEIALTKKEYGILEYLLFNRGRKVGAAELAEHLWEDDADRYLSVLKVHINFLKKKLRAASGNGGIIRNARGFGYYVTEETGR